MKILLSWVQKHIVEKIDTNKINFLISKFNTSVAEIEKFISVPVCYKNFEMAKIISKKLYLADKKEIVLSDSFLTEIEQGFILLKKNDDEFSLATLKDFGQERETIFPFLSLSEKEFEESLWKQHLPEKDFILEVDNKSLTNRPDMWSHRGFAREIALILGLTLKPKINLLETIDIEKTEQNKFNDQNFSFENKAPDCCSKFSLSKLSINNNFSTPGLSMPLAMIGAKPYNAIIDLTNYLMFDWGNPVHAFDGTKSNKKCFSVRLAQNEEKITLLGNTNLTLNSKNLIVTIDDVPVALAGIKGGQKSGVLPCSENIFLESACFNPSVIRRSSQQHKLRTDASSIFEKKITSENLEDVHARFLALAKENNIPCKLDTKVYVAGPTEKKIKINVSHSFLEQKIGIHLDPKKIVFFLSSLEFDVKTHIDDQGTMSYLIDVPAFRATKNVTTPEDIFEEIARLNGFENVSSVVPKATRTPFDLKNILKQRQIKRFFAYAASMIEQSNYPFFDESFLEKISYDPESILNVKNPVSENNKRLVSSLIPGLLKNVLTNFFYAENLSFFEMANVWVQAKDENTFSEKKMISGLFFERSSRVDFYEKKEIINNLANLLDLGEFIWEKTNIKNFLFDENKTADIFLNETIIGQAGMISSKILSKLNANFLPTAFFFELEVSPLLNDKFTKKIFHPISKYQSSYVDISGFIPKDKFFADFHEKLSHLNPLVKTVSLLDSFEKDQKKSLTFRLHLESHERSVEKSDIEMITSLATMAFTSLGGIVR